jgi:hypothetical protein
MPHASAGPARRRVHALRPGGVPTIFGASGLATVTRCRGRRRVARGGSARCAVHDGHADPAILESSPGPQHSRCRAHARTGRLTHAYVGRGRANRRTERRAHAHTHEHAHTRAPTPTHAHTRTRTHSHALARDPYVACGSLHDSRGTLLAVAAGRRPLRPRRAAIGRRVWSRPHACMHAPMRPARISRRAGFHARRRRQVDRAELLVRIPFVNPPCPLLHCPPSRSLRRGALHAAWFRVHAFRLAANQTVSVKAMLKDDQAPEIRTATLLIPVSVHQVHA